MIDTLQGPPHASLTTGSDQTRCGGPGLGYGFTGDLDPEGTSLQDPRSRGLLEEFLQGQRAAGTELSSSH